MISVGDGVNYSKEEMMTPALLEVFQHQFKIKSDFGKSQMGIFSEDLVLLIKLFLSRRK